VAAGGAGGGDRTVAPGGGEPAALWLEPSDVEVVIVERADDAGSDGSLAISAAVGGSLAGGSLGAEACRGMGGAIDCSIAGGGAVRAATGGWVVGGAVAACGGGPLGNGAAKAADMVSGGSVMPWPLIGVAVSGVIEGGAVLSDSL